MPDDAPPKTAYELAMERLRAKDRAEGVEQGQPLTREQKDEIARLRQAARAKLAELEILLRQNLEEESDPEKLRELQEHHAIDRRRVESGLESAVAKIKRGRAGPPGS